jgi:uncharacterized membrane protein YccC
MKDCARLTCAWQVCVVLSEKVDMTVSKGILRILGTAIGATLGKQKLIRLVFTFLCLSLISYDWGIC